MNYSYDYDLGLSPSTLQGTAIQFSPGLLPPIDEINGVSEVNWYGGPNPTFLSNCDGNNFNVSGGNVDWNKNGSYSGTVAQILRVVNGCCAGCCVTPTTPEVLVDINDAGFMAMNMASFIGGAGDGGEQDDGAGKLDLSEAVKGIDRNDKEALTRAIRDALERREAERGAVDVNAIRQARLSEKAAAFKARNGVTELPSCEKQ